MVVRIVPWVRSGLSLDVTNQATRGQTTQVRATATIDVSATADDGETVLEGPSREVEFFGPGDIVSIDENQVRHRYPTPNAPDAEWNFFAFIELVHADLPWRYAPAGPSDGIAPPWLALVVVEEGVEATFDSSSRLPVLRVDSAEHLPPPADLWAWAHAFGHGDPVADVDGFNARIMCPRRLRPNSHWRACLVPAFRTGRNAGLGAPPGDDPGPAWRADETGVELPVYSTWTFHTGDRDGTFLALAQKLTPRELGPGVGTRPLDLSEPGAPLPAAQGARTDFLGAMFSPQYDPDGRITADIAAFRSTYREELTRGDDVPETSNEPYDAATDDPVVRLPRYGSPQRRGEPLPDDDAHWYAQVNTRPERRAVAALGASVVRNDQEDLLAAAWEHAASLTQINQSLQRARLAEEMATQRVAKFRTLGTGNQFQLAGPAARRISTGSTDLLAALDAAAVSPIVAGGSFRRMTRPGGVFQRATVAQPATASTPAPAENFVTRTLTDGAAAFLEAEPNQLPAGLDIGERIATPAPTFGTLDVDQFVTFDPGTAAPQGLSLEPLQVTWATPASTMTIGNAFVALAAPPAAPTVQAAPATRTAAARATGSITAVGPMRSFPMGPPLGEPFPTGWAIDNNIPISQVLPELRERILDQVTRLVAERPADALRRGTEAVELPTFDTDVGDLMTSQIDPASGVRAWVDRHIAQRNPNGSSVGILGNDTAIPTALVARPSFHVPMYERLRALSVEYVVPGAAAIPANTVSALSVNHAFVESFLIGANHELSREFRWREYPAPLHLTWFDQFWDVGPNGDADIPPIWEWEDGRLGSHATGGDRLVVIVKGDLIDRFPNLSVYMVEAKLDPEPPAGGSAPATTVETERVMADTDPELPVFSGRLMPGLHFYGFELPNAPEGQVEAAQTGGTHSQGWFFGLEEQPRSARFGLNVGKAAHVGNVPDESFKLSWRHMKQISGDNPLFIDEAETPAVFENHEFDTGRWFGDAATMAATTFRRPTRVLIHATALLGED